MFSVLKSFGKYQDSIGKKCSRNECPLQAKLCNKRWRVVSLLMSVWLLLLLRRPSHSSYLISTYNACKQHILICSVSILPNSRKNITMVVKLRFQAFSVNATHLRVCSCKNWTRKFSWKMDCIHFFSSQVNQHMLWKKMAFISLDSLFQFFWGIFWVGTPKTT